MGCSRRIKAMWLLRISMGAWNSTGRRSLLMASLFNPTSMSAALSSVVIWANSRLLSIRS
ncbi:hypothetical protein D3C72_2279560 [compost metagenome]